MDADPLTGLFGGGNLPLTLSALALFIALIALWLTSGARRQAAKEVESLQRSVGVLGREVDDLRVNEFEAPDANPSPSSSETERYLSEKQAYEQLWPQIWHLYDRLGMFLRAVEGGEAAGDLRLEARNAALQARARLNQSRPFCSGPVEELVTHLIDTEIKAHLAACQYLDLLKDATAAPSDHDRRALQEKCHTLHEVEGRHLLTQLVAAIRDRTIASY